MGVDDNRYIYSTDVKVLERLAGAGFQCDKPGRTPVPGSKLGEVELLLKGLAYIVGPDDDVIPKKDEWAKYDSGWGPDPFHTVGD